LGEIPTFAGHVVDVEVAPSAGANAIEIPLWRASVDETFMTKTA
jgi:hypothetical protein